MKSIILEIQEAAISRSVDVSGLLRKAKVAAVKLGEDDAVEWIDLELDGYDKKFDDLPKYRQAHGILKVRNPYRDLVPVHFENAEIEELLTRTPISDGVGVIQSLLNKNSPNSTLSFSMSNHHRTMIANLLNVDFEPVLLMTKSQLTTILERVVSLVLNWSLALEKAGILGEGMSFSMSEKEKSRPITQNIIANNIGHLGDVTGGARATVIQTNSSSLQLDNRKLESFIDQAEQATALLPPSVQQSFRSELEKLKSASTDTEKGAALESAKAVLEGTAGNLAATGILGLIASIVG
jgi:AbiTii